MKSHVPFTQLPFLVTSDITVAQYQTQEADTGTLFTSLQALFSFHNVLHAFSACVSVCMHS